MSNLVEFSFDKKTVRTLNKEGELFFRASDVAECLSMETSNMLRMTDTQDDLRKAKAVDALGRTQEATFLSEGGLYTVLLRSNKPQAKPFRQWVTKEVLPTIRRQGFYLSEQLKKEIAEKDNEIARKEQVIMQLRAKKVPRGNLGYHYEPETQPALDNFEPKIVFKRVPNGNLDQSQLKAIGQAHTLRTLEGLIQKIVADNGHRACYDIFASLFRNFIPE